MIHAILVLPGLYLAAIAQFLKMLIEVIGK